MKKLPAFNKNPTCEVIDEILCGFQILKEVVPYRGEMDPEKKQITINPAFDCIEVLAHEMLHYYFNYYIGTGAMEWLVKVKAKEMIKQQITRDLLEQHLQRATIVPTRNLYGMVG